MSVLDVAIVGAGAAGISAGRRLRQTHLCFRLFEASDRIGGRAWTRSIEAMPLDLGCGWLHSADRNPWVPISEDLGFTIDKTPSAWGKQFENLGFGAREQSEAWKAFEEFGERLRHQPPPSDRAADALEPGGLWNAYLEALSSYMNGVALGALSVADYLTYESASTRLNWRVREGYGAMIAAAARDLPVELLTPVNVIDRRGDLLRLVTPGQIIEARVAIVTVPTSVLARGALRFDPPLAEKSDAAAALPLGLADKLFLKLDDAAELDPDQHLLGSPRRAETGSYYLRPFGRPLIEAFFGGTAALQLEREGLEGMTAFAIEELVDLFGSNMRRRLHALTGSRWCDTDWIWGSYSHALPGHAKARAALAAPVENRLFFAGEACSITDFSTAHGAYASGDAAARHVIERLTGENARTEKRRPANAMPGAKEG